MTDSEQIVHLSQLGPTIDVAKPSTKKLYIIGAIWILITIAELGFMTALLLEIFSPQTIGEKSSMSGSDGIFMVIGIPVVIFMTWFSLASAVQQFYAAGATNRYFRAGPCGICGLLPDNSFRAIFLFQTKMVPFAISWDQIKTWYPHTFYVNGIPINKSIVFKTPTDAEFKVSTYHFAEKQQVIADNIQRAKLSTLVVSENHPISTTAANSQPVSNQPVNTLPEHLLEKSLVIQKKKKSLVKELDLTGININHRISVMEQQASTIEKLLTERFPAAEYRHIRKNSKPFQERPNLYGISLTVQRGLLWGYQLHLEPADIEYRKLKLSIDMAYKIGVIQGVLALGGGAITFLFCLYSIPYQSEWLGDWSRFSMLFMLFDCMAVVGLVFGIVQLPISLYLWATSKGKTHVAEKADLSQQLNEKLEIDINASV